MGLYITFQVNEHGQYKYAPSEPYIFLDFASWLFLDDVWKQIQTKTTQLVDIYDGAIFENEKLDVVVDELSKALEKIVKDMPQVVTQPCGTEISPDGSERKLSADIHKTALMNSLNGIILLAQKAKSQDKDLNVLGN